jgi:NADH:ubiquinone oxidoreductase subunit F (NADH-binding)
MLQDGVFNAVFSSNPFNTLLTVQPLDVALDFISIKARELSLDTFGMIVLFESTVSLARSLST